LVCIPKIERRGKEAIEPFDGFLDGKTTRDEALRAFVEAVEEGLESREY